MAQRYAVDIKITRLLLQIGLMCARLKQFEDARLIIGSVKTFRDDLPHPGSVMALCLLHQGRFEQAREQLENILAAWPDHQIARALLGLAYRQTGNADWSKVLQQVIDDGRDQWATWLAQHSLDSEAFADLGSRP